MAMTLPRARLIVPLLLAVAMATSTATTARAALRLATAAAGPLAPVADAPIVHSPSPLPPQGAGPSADAPPTAPPGGPVATAAVLRGLNKITGRVVTIDAPIGQPVRFGALQIVAHTCVQRPPTAPPDDIAFLSIDDVKPDGRLVRIFTGWMFKSSPSLSALQNPVYDVWVEGCKF